jgi:F0F1-type ATP synthase assembly protein I
MAEASAWASHVMTISLEMVIPGLIGLWIDRQLGTVMLFLVLGVALGMTVGMLHLVRLATSMHGDEPSDQESSDNDLGK